MIVGKIQNTHNLNDNSLNSFRKILKVKYYIVFYIEENSLEKDLIYVCKISRIHNFS